MLGRLWTGNKEAVSGRIKSALVGALGERLVSLIQYFPNDGIFSSEDARGRENLLIVLDELDLQTLASCADAFQSAVKTSSISPMVLSQAELKASTDVFPITFMEMKRKYDLLAGKDVLVDLDISKVHLRLRCEQELKNLLLRMQSTVLLRNHHAAELLESLRASYGTLLRCLRATTHVTSEQTGWTTADALSVNELDSDIDSVHSFATEQLGVDAEVLERTNEVCSLNASIGADAIAEIYGQLLLEVHRAAAVVDELEGSEVIVLDSLEG